MSTDLDDVRKLALDLTVEERLSLADELLASVEPAGSPFDPEWLAESARRAARIASGEGGLRDWAEVRDRARERLRGPGGA